MKIQLQRNQTSITALIFLSITLAGCTSDNAEENDEQDASLTTTSEVLASPRFDDGLIRLDRTPGEFGGYWAQADAISLIEDGVDVSMDASGLLVNLDDASTVAPFMPWSLALYQFRQSIDLRSDPVNVCVSPGGPRHLMDPDGFRIIQDRNFDRIYILFGGGNMNWRIIWMDGRDLPNPDEITPTFFGNSVGRWEADTLIVESSGFSERFWFSNGGQPHTGALTLTERFTRSDYETLSYEVTVNDPHTYTRPWTSSWHLNWMKGMEIEEDFCEDNTTYTIQ